MKKTKSVLSSERYAELQANLEAMKKEVASEISHLLQGIKDANQVNGHGSKLEGDINDNDLDLNLVRLKGQILEQIDRVLERLHTGTYGICVECEEEISLRRLAATRFAIRCLSCETRREGAVQVSGRDAPYRPEKHVSNPK